MTWIAAHPYLSWLAWWLVGLALMTWQWWRHHDVALGDAATFAFGTAFMGPALVCLYWYSRWREGAPGRPPIVLIYGRARKLR